MKAAFKRGPLARWPVLQRCNQQENVLICRQLVGKIQKVWKPEGSMACRPMEMVPEQSKVDPKVYNTADSQVVTQPGTDAALQDLTSVIGREPVLSLWCGRRRRERVKSCSMAQTMR